MWAYLNTEFVTAYYKHNPPSTTVTTTFTTQGPFLITDEVSKWTKADWDKFRDVWTDIIIRRGESTLPILTIPPKESEYKWRKRYRGHFIDPDEGPVS